MSTHFKLDTDAARKAGQPGRIQATGRYKGQIVAAWHEESQGGAQGFKCQFKSDDGQHAEIAVWTHNKDGKALSGANLIHALMACTSLRELTASAGTVKLYDRKEQKDVDKPRQVYAALAGKPVGLFLEAEKSLFTKDDGSDGEFIRMNLAAPFRAEDGKMAKEILDKSPKAEAADKYEAWLMARPMRTQDRRVQPGFDRGAGHADASYGERAGGGFDDDDIPFAPITLRSYL